MAGAVSVRCPSCQVKLTLKSRSAAGKQVPCPKCGKPFVVKLPSAPASKKPVPEDEVEEAQDEYETPDDDFSSDEDDAEPSRPFSHPYPHFRLRIRGDRLGAGSRFRERGAAGPSIAVAA